MACLDMLSSLTEALRALCDSGSSVAGMVNLTANDAVFTGFTDEKNPIFAESWPSSLPDSVLETDEFVAVVEAVRTVDPRLQKRCDRLVPKKVEELVFWRSYLGHVHLVLIAMRDPEHRRRAFLSSLPPARPAAERRYPLAAGDLQVEGQVPLPQSIDFLERCIAMVKEEETGRLLYAAGCRGEDVAKLSLQFQLELMESCGVERRFGCSQMLATALCGKDDAEAAEAKKINDMQRELVQVCQQSMVHTKKRIHERAPGDPAARRFKLSGPPEELLAAGAGAISLAKLLEVIVGMTDWIASDETLEVLQSHLRAPTAPIPPGILLRRWQREYMEHCGVEQDFGVASISSAAQGSDEIGVAVGKLSQLCASVQQRAISSTMRAGPAGERRFKPRDDGGTMQTQGKLAKKQAIAFCQGIAKELMSPESLQLLASMSPDLAKFANIRWQREYLEFCGIEQDFGCQALSNLPNWYGRDEEVARSFKMFQTACGIAMKKAHMMRTELQQARAGGGGAAGAETKS